MAEATVKKESSTAAIIGWGGLLVFMAGFAWIVINQIRGAEIWADRGDEAVETVRAWKPGGGDDLNLGDLLKGYSLKVRERGGPLSDETGDYVGEFSWDAKQKNGPEYEVTLVWKESYKGDTNTRVAVWRVDLEKTDIRPQGDVASSLPNRAREGIVG
jgi:hypothetical protein